MDRSLDDVINERQRNQTRSNRGATRDRRPPRDGIRKTYRRDDARGLDRDWVHDRYEDEPSSRHDERDYPPRQNRREPYAQHSRGGGAKLRIENVHYDLSEDDLRDLFTRKGPIVSVHLTYDRQDRSTGVAYVVYEDARDAEDAIRDFDGANAAGQPIRISFVQNTSARPARNPFDTAERPSRSMFDRIEDSDRRRRIDSEDESQPPRRVRTGRAPREDIDRYIPGEGRREGRNNSQRRSPRRDGRGGRRPGQRRQAREQEDPEGRPIVGGRPRKTAEELDAEMADYWGGGNDNTNGAAGNAQASTAPAAEQAMDVDDI